MRKHLTPPLALDAREHIRALCRVPDSHEVILMRGDRQLHYGLIAMHFLRTHAHYYLTGVESEAALAAARTAGDARDASELSAGASYVHYTSANAYEGTQWRTPPPGTPLICDMSDDIFTRDIDVAAHALIYADLGEVSLVLADKAFLREAGARLPPGLCYSARERVDSPALSLYLAWRGENSPNPVETHAYNLYRELDAFPSFYRGCAPTWRSQVSAVFRLPSEELEQAFIAEAERAGFTGLVASNGIRIGLSNAMPSIIDFVRFMRSFARRHQRGNLSPGLRAQLLARWPDANTDALPKLDMLSLGAEGLTAITPDGRRRVLEWRGEWTDVAAASVPSFSDDPLREPLPAPFAAGTLVRFVGDARTGATPGRLYVVSEVAAGRRGTGRMVPDPNDYEYAPREVMDTTTDDRSVIVVDDVPTHLYQVLKGPRRLHVSVREATQWQVIEPVEIPTY